MKCRKLTAAVLAAAVFAGAPYAVARLQNVSVVANADGEWVTEGDWTYYVRDDGRVQMGRYNGTDTDIIIPSTIGERSVSAIGPLTFEGCTFVTSVSIPSTVTDILDPGRGIFKDCVLLENITVDVDNENYTSENGVLFNKDKTELMYYSQGKSASSYSIPAGVEEIYEYAFYNASNLISVTIPDGVKVIGALAFNGCTSLASLSIPDSVTELWFYNKGGDSFDGCTSLESVTVGANNTNYMSEDGVVFNKDKTELLFYPAGKKDTSYVIPDGVTLIRDPGFNGNTYLTDVTIPASLTGAYRVFRDCTSITTVNFGGTMEQWNSISIGNDHLTNVTIICTDGIINEREPDTSEPTSSGTSEPTSSDTSEPASSVVGETLTPATPVTPVTPEDTTSSETSSSTSSETSSTTSTDTSSTTSTNTSETTSNDTDTTLTIVDKDTGITVEVSKEDADLIDADFTVDPANHGSLLDLIKKIVEKVADTVSEEVKKSLDEAAETVKNGKGFAYDISFRKNGAEVQPDRKVTVTVPVPDEFKSDIDKLNVYHLTDKGAVFVPSWIKDGAVVFETDSFSPYVITMEKLANAVGEELTSSAPDSSLNDNAPSDGVSNPYTGGIAMAFAPIAALAAVTIAAVSKKKK